MDKQQKASGQKNEFPPDYTRQDFKRQEQVKEIKNKFNDLLSTAQSDMREAEAIIARIRALSLESARVLDKERKNYLKKLTEAAKPAKKLVEEQKINNELLNTLKVFEDECRNSSNFLTKVEEIEMHLIDIDEAQKNTPYVLAEKEWEECKRQINGLANAKDIQEFKNIESIIESYYKSIDEGDKTPMDRTPKGYGTPATGD